MAAPDALAALFRAEHGRILARLIGLLGDVDLAEEALAEAYASAAARWDRDGVPDHPVAWLLTTARRKAIDRVRRDRTREAALPTLGTEMTRTDPEPPAADDQSVPDERLALFFTCCHPALNQPAQVALTLRCLAGLTTGEVARLFLTSETTIAQRLVRAKRKIRDTKLPYRVPDRDELPDRLPAVLAVLYLLYTEGYTSTAGPGLVHDELCAEAVRLARTLHDLLPEEPDTAALLALLVLTDARRDARRDAEGRLVRLTDQNRALYDHHAITEGRHLLARALRSGATDPYAIQAAIAALHAGAPTAADTDWPQIASLYQRLHDLDPSPMVALNHAIAVGEADGPQAGLTLLEDLEARQTLPTSHLLPAARAELLRRLGRHADATAAYTAAIERTTNAAERAHLIRRCDEPTPSSADHEENP